MQWHILQYLTAMLQQYFYLQRKIENISDLFLRYSVLCGKRRENIVQWFIRNWCQRHRHQISNLKNEFLFFTNFPISFGKKFYSGKANILFTVFYIPHSSSQHPNSSRFSLLTPAATEAQNFLNHSLYFSFFLSAFHSQCSQRPENPFVVMEKLARLDAPRELLLRMNFEERNLPSKMK